MFSLALATALPPLAQTWDGYTNTYWSTGANWDNDVVPGAGDTVTISGAGGTNQPTVDTPQTVTQTIVTGGTLTVGDTLTLPVTVLGTGNLTINADGEIVGAVFIDPSGTMNVGTVSVTGSMASSNVMVSAGRTVTGTGTGGQHISKWIRTSL